MFNLKSVGDSGKTVKQVCILPGGIPEMICSSYGRTACYVSLKESDLETLFMKIKVKLRFALSEPSESSWQVFQSNVEKMVKGGLGRN